MIDGDVMESYTFNEKGEKVKNLVKGKVIKDTTLAEQLLPTQAGFFFGGTDYDEYYIHDLEQTREILEKCLLAETEGEYEYHSSW